MTPWQSVTGHGVDNPSFSRSLHCNSSQVPDTWCHVFLVIAPAQIAKFRFLLEGYDHLAVLTTLDKDNGLVRLGFARSRSHELFILLQDIASQLVR